MIITAFGALSALNASRQTACCSDVGRLSAHSIRAVSATKNAPARACDASAEAVASLIRRTRGDLGLTQFELAQRMGSQQATVARWESGEHEITFKNLSRIANALSVEFIVRFGQESAVA